MIGYGDPVCYVNRKRSVAPENHHASLSPGPFSGIAPASIHRDAGFRRSPRNVGFNRWAAAYRLVIVYPQTRTTNDNYGGCWDWWGYTGQQFDTRTGSQWRGCRI
ncbi:hypothetical protein Busp01_30460 [Trinickia caryophylli]|uniref:Uncharacterized protein n=1 Tax=Trinickia caryophylli TaxID=28094 RepID=A0A1X7FPZ6_TRICW|nr:hypothetical protein C0Z17_24465 [Trinickia caryophylli]GLU33204.1 hypothetical protein Busp01_30460 [Trinickia caryophylli]SMF56455.1 hypothetical protein SAMN06295900_110149 [Trinickia caryophylli]